MKRKTTLTVTRPIAPAMSDDEYAKFLAAESEKEDLERLANRLNAISTLIDDLADDLREGEFLIAEDFEEETMESLHELLEQVRPLRRRVLNVLKVQADTKTEA